MKRAYCTIREKPHYRRDSFVAGLKASGFHVEFRLPSAPPGPGDVLVIWNRYSDHEQTADTWERQGGTVLVAENGYCGRDAAGQQLYAIAAHGHNGSGTWPDRDGEEDYGARWRALGMEIGPWRESGEHILVCPNRHFGMRGLAMPIDWEASTVKQLRAVTRRPIRVRPHPNGGAPATPLAADLENCLAVVVWASSAGVHALLSGVPVVCTAPWWILKDCGASALKHVEQARAGERLPHFERLAWAQWTVEEIALGLPFRYLLPDARQGEVAQAA